MSGEKRNTQDTQKTLCEYIEVHIYPIAAAAAYHSSPALEILLKWKLLANYDLATYSHIDKPLKREHNGSLLSIVKIRGK